ncbi:GIY-YIG nuclease family protein [Mucilaginibacter sp. JRF]|uniref:GIY-YIG nuclease family protein n=1 Tax=Mucilaginibacter sp. JRF TaxID=2780088 RepID=UPI001880ABD0|nr:GIY-YIG nuclease family protein [Mucilaginibacter sp. JRF]MBE9583073.1 GIY-YIG nuclease family protein [Mucilaginibacter sp. JRF]
MWNHNYYVYILTNVNRSVLYIGVTNDLTRRLFEHTDNDTSISSFTKKYNCKYLIYYERFTHIDHAIQREKELKKWRRDKKDLLINTQNSDWRFLNDEVLEY